MASGCLKGVTRKITIREIDKLGLSLVEKDAPLATLLSADEVFICSSLKLVLGVASVRDDRGVHALANGPITGMLRDRFLSVGNIGNDSVKTNPSGFFRNGLDDTINKFFNTVEVLHAKGTPDSFFIKFEILRLNKKTSDISMNKRLGGYPENSGGGHICPCKVTFSI